MHVTLDCMRLQNAPSNSADALAAAVRVLIVGNRGGTNVGASLERAAKSLSIAVHLMDATRAMDGPRWLRMAKWHLMGHTPARLSGFSRDVVTFCRKWKPDLLITTGLAPITREALAQIRALGIRCSNYSTDDPWNPEHRAHWFLDALSEYDFIFTPRHANIDELKRISQATVSCVPFAYDPELFYPEQLDPVERATFASDVVFAGGADKDRVLFVDALQRKNIKVALYGSYWERFPETRRLTRGQADVPTLRKAIAGAKVALCLVRRANRDGHSMRTFEVPAVGTCMVVEKTNDHLRLFGPGGRAVLYFDTPTEMVDIVARLLEHPDERSRLAKNAHELVMQGHHTYADRLQTILSEVGCGVSE